MHLYSAYSYSYLGQSSGVVTETWSIKIVAKMNIIEIIFFLRWNKYLDRVLHIVHIYLWYAIVLHVHLLFTYWCQFTSFYHIIVVVTSNQYWQVDFLQIFTFLYQDFTICIIFIKYVIKLKKVYMCLF